MKIIIKDVCSISVRWTMSCWRPEELFRHVFITYTEIPHLIISAGNSDCFSEAPHFSCFRLSGSSSNSISANFLWKTAMTTSSLNSYEASEYIFHSSCSTTVDSVKDTCVSINSIQDILEQLQMHEKTLGHIFQKETLVPENISEDLSRQQMVHGTICEIFIGCKKYHMCQL